ncbi:DNA ligase D [Alkalihalobacillus alcalophilus]|nr:DNA ligase D [Alkalihalobacillus alcalophilus]MED1560724.1 DNA ligase D [Alkalihalobacillus alcalophilus]
MLLTTTTELPIGDDWLYEIKYDGFRCLFEWKEEIPRLLSRNGNDLSPMFPEIIKDSERMYEQIKAFLPLILDGELVYLINPYHSDFKIVQRRGKLRTKSQIRKFSERLPTQFLAFDFLEKKGLSLEEKSLTVRKKELSAFFSSIGQQKVLQLTQTFNDLDEITQVMKAHFSEGIVAKKKKSIYTQMRSQEWLKYKNYRFVHVIVTSYEKQNGYFKGVVYKGDRLVEVVNFSHGMSNEEKRTLSTLFQKNGELIQKEVWQLPPSICVKVGCIGFDGKHLREPLFDSFLLEEVPEECTWQTMQRQLTPFPEQVKVTRENKPVWPKLELLKEDYLSYLQYMFPYLLPFLNDRLLTTIRYPHGANSEAFYQKNCPDYAPEFVQTFNVEEIEYILCNDLETLLWLGNQLALEFHIPFQQKDQIKPSEIVFDLDPPSVNEFSLAITAAKKMKEVFEQFSLNAFVKTSGNKGIQLYLPLPEEIFTYRETRLFCEFVSEYICEQNPELFTLERLKKNRNGRLYIDYLQHDQGKTIIAPYSPRGHERGLIATPLYWDEVDDNLNPNLFTVQYVLERIRSDGDPFRTFRSELEEQKENFQTVIEQLIVLKEQRKRR